MTHYRWVAVDWNPEPRYPKREGNQHYIWTSLPEEEVDAQTLTSACLRIELSNWTIGRLWICDHPTTLETVTLSTEYIYQSDYWTYVSPEMALAWATKMVETPMTVLMETLGTA